MRLVLVVLILVGIACGPSAGRKPQPAPKAPPFDGIELQVSRELRCRDISTVSFPGGVRACVLPETLILWNYRSGVVLDRGQPLREVDLEVGWQSGSLPLESRFAASRDGAIVACLAKSSPPGEPLRYLGLIEESSAAQLVLRSRFELKDRFWSGVLSAPDDDGRRQLWTKEVEVLEGRVNRSFLRCYDTPLEGDVGALAPRVSVESPKSMVTWLAIDGGFVDAYWLGHIRRLNATTGEVEVIDIDSGRPLGGVLAIEHGSSGRPRVLFSTRREIGSDARWVLCVERVDDRGWEERWARLIPGFDGSTYPEATARDSVAFLPLDDDSILVLDLEDGSERGRLRLHDRARTGPQRDLVGPLRWIERSGTRLRFAMQDRGRIGPGQWGQEVVIECEVSPADVTQLFSPSGELPTGR